ncbi:MAG: MFS transporter [Candidatus Obscuribacterales bacterium]|nr:MFS transporter [Candidatus Obscuribacterales bacterium]
MSGTFNSTFRSLNGYNYRVWASGAIVSNIGTWMQRTAQDWIVLTQLTHNNATAVGIVMALQFGPQVAFLPVTGWAADHFDKRKLLVATQAAMGALALGLGLLTVSGLVQLWHVYFFAFGLGCVTAFDSPARQSFVSEMVDEANLSNAVALNSSSFNAARMIGPAVAGVLISSVGSGVVFLINAASFVAVLYSLKCLRVEELHHRDPVKAKKAKLADGFRYISKRPDIKAILVMVFLIGTFGLNFPIYISTMAVTAFHTGASKFGFLTSMMAMGSVTGALLSARRDKPRVAFLFAGTAIFGAGLFASSLMPNYFLFGMTLMLVGVAAQTFNTTAIGAVQLATEPGVRGRVMAIFLAVAQGGTPIGAPIVGWVADHYGPRAGLLVGALAGMLASIVWVAYLTTHRNLRMQMADGRPKFSFDETQAIAAQEL